jgi:hypothetical protein
MKRLGEFYREKVLILPKSSLIKKELTTNFGNIRIEADLYGWKLFNGRDFIECRSEDEARFLRIFFDAGLNEVFVPKDDDYLKNILPDIEDLKSRTDKIVNSYIETIMDRKIRERLRHEVYLELTK